MILTLSDSTITHPTAWEQIEHSVGIMYTTITKVVSSQSDVGVQHLAGPIGIGKGYYQMLTSPDGWKMALSFTVLFNINLAILNMLPFPVLDGGHITLIHPGDHCSPPGAATRVRVRSDRLCADDHGPVSLHHFEGCWLILHQ